MESKLHKELKQRAYKYIWNKGYRIAKVELYAGYYGIYDAWGINYSSYYTIGIEVKISRGDFLTAHKYKNRKLEVIYKDRLNWGGANENYYLCPSGLIQPEETGVYGLLWFNGKRFINKKRPKYINISLKGKMTQLMNFLEPKPHDI